MSSVKKIDRPLFRLPSFSSTWNMSGFWLEAALAVWVLFLIVLPIVVLAQIPAALLAKPYVEVRAHAVIEGFCGFIALLIAGMTLSTSLKRHWPALPLFGLGFLLMSGLDFLHAITDPIDHSREFVLYHTLSALAGGVFIFLGIVVLGYFQRRRPTIQDIAALSKGILVIIGIAYFYEAFMPKAMIGEKAAFLAFSPWAHATHEIAGFIYALSALACYRYYRVHRHAVALIIASLLAVFGESAYLFSFSRMWDLTWWIWHGAKLVFYCGVMATVFGGFLVALNTIEKSRRVLARANERLQKTQSAVKRVNQELTIRNQMAREAMTSLDMDNVMDVISRALGKVLGPISCELILKIPEDEISEFQRKIHRSRYRWPIYAEHHPVACSHAKCSPVPQTSFGVYECARTALHSHAACLTLLASGEAFGHIKITVQNRSLIQKSGRQLQALSAELGSILHNTLLYHRWQEENEFRLALLRVTEMLTSTLDLGRVVESVCSESARLLDSDGALVWLPDASGSGFVMVGKCLRQSPGMGEGQIEAWCKDHRLCESVLRQLDGHYQPRSFLFDELPADILASAGEGEHPSAIALFPLLDETQLIGTMVLVRKDRVPFSAATLSKGELLAGQVRIAINNASSYRRLSEINDQLKIAEESKLRGERLAVLGQMAASVAHEVKNPLGAISNCLAVLKAEAGVTGKARTALEIIQEEVVRLDKLARDFLVFGRPGVARVGPVALGGLLVKVCTALERHVAQNELKVEIEREVPRSDIPVYFDANGLEVVLWNLLLNAVQSISGKGQVRAVLRFGPDHFTIVVADTGKGIPLEERNKIFEPFYSQRSHGAGLGLAIVQRYVEDWSGRMRLSSTPGMGTAFFLRVPLGNGPLDSRAPTPSGER